MNWEDIRHEIVSVIIGAVVSCFIRIAMRIGSDLNKAWQRIRTMEERIQKLEESKDAKHSN